MLSQIKGPDSCIYNLTLSHLTYRECELPPSRCRCPTSYHRWGCRIFDRWRLGDGRRESCRRRRRRERCGRWRCHTGRRGWRQGAADRVFGENGRRRGWALLLLLLLLLCTLYRDDRVQMCYCRGMGKVRMMLRRMLLVGRNVFWIAAAAACHCFSTSQAGKGRWRWCGLATAITTLKYRDSFYW